MAKQEKKTYIEYLRVASMLAVIMIHVCITAISDFPDGGTLRGGALYWSVRNTFHFAVPCFFMISGALLLNPAKEIPLKKLFHRYILKYAGVIIVFGWGYALIEEVFKGKNLKLSYIGASFLNMLQGKTWEHMWYMYALLGVMLFLPVLRLMTRYLGAKELSFIIVPALFFLSLVPLFTAFFGGESGVSYPLGSIYCVYMLLGWLLDTEAMKIPAPAAAIGICFGAAVCVIAAVGKMYFNLKLMNLCTYTSPVILILAVSVFSLFKSGRYPAEGAHPVWERVIAFLSKYSFAVYIVHMFFINLCYKLFRINPFQPNALIMMLLVWAVVLACSLCTSVLLKRLPFFRSLV